MTDVISQADRFADNAHKSVLQLRRYTSLPYIEHPRAVARIVRTVPHTPQMIAAALLHDVIEDTAVTLAQVLAVFGGEVTHLVDELTVKNRPTAGSRAMRQAIELQRLANISSQAQTIKLADILDNVESIATHDPAFARIYVPEKLAQVKVLQGADPRLHKRALDTVTLVLEGLSRDKLRAA